MGVQSLGNLTLDTIEGTAADKEDIPSVYVDIVLIWMLAPTLGRYVHHRSFEQLQQSLLHTLATHVARDAGIVTLAGYLVDLVDEDDTTLSCLHIIVCHLQQA